VIQALSLTTGTISVVAGEAYSRGSADGSTAPGGPARLASPSALAVNSAGDVVYIADYGCIRQLNLTSQQLATIAGACNTAGLQDAPVGTGARFTNVQSMAVRSTATGDQLLVADLDSSQRGYIRAVDLSPSGAYAVTTLVLPTIMAGTSARAGWLSLALDHEHDVLYLVGGLCACSAAVG
jgi:hypothetical protein